MKDHFVVAVKNRSVAFSKPGPPNRNLAECHVMALSYAQRTPQRVIDPIGDRMLGRDAEFGRISIMCADPGLRHGLSANLRCAMGPGWLDR